jgi:hypothetical protein
MTVLTTALALSPRGDIGCERVGFAARHVQRFVQKNNLADVVCVMGYLAIGRLHHGMRLSPDREGTGQIGMGEWLDCRKNQSPITLPTWSNSSRVFIAQKCAAK